MTLPNLIERLEMAEVGSRELDVSVMIACNATSDHTCAPDERLEINPHTPLLVDVVTPRGNDVVGYTPQQRPVTASIEAAMDIVDRVLPGWKWRVEKLDYGFTAAVQPPLRTQGDLQWQDLGEIHSGPHKCLCLVIALLKALQAKEEAGR